MKAALGQQMGKHMIGREGRERKPAEQATAAPDAAAVAREIRAQEAAEKKAQTRKGALGCLVFFVILILGVWIWVESRPTVEGEPEESITMPDGTVVTKAVATVMCQSEVRNQLLAPGTAKFPGIFSAGYTQPAKFGETWYQLVNVDSENVFGAMLRTSWDCDIHGPLGTITVELRP